MSALSTDTVARTAEPQTKLDSVPRFVAHYVRRYWAQFALLLGFVVVAATCAIVAQFQMKQLVDAMSEGSAARRNAWQALGLFVGLIGFETLLWRLASRITCRTTVEAGVIIRLDLFEHLSHLPTRFFNEISSGATGQRLTGAAGAFGAIVNIAAWRIVPPCVDLAGALVIFGIINVQMALVLGLTVTAVVSVLVRRGLQQRGVHADYFREANAIAGDLIDVVSHMWVVRAFSARSYEMHRLHSRFEQEAVYQRRSWLSNENTRLVYDIVLWLTATAMVAWALTSWSQHRLSPGDVVVISALTFRILHGSRDFSVALLDENQQWTYLHETLEFIGKEAPQRDGQYAAAKPTARGSIELTDASFTHAAGQKTLDGIDLVVGAGEKIGIVGPSGAGKTTLIQVIQRVHEIDSGHLSFDGVPVERITLDSLHALISVVPQEVVLLHRSVRENISYGRPDATDSEVMAAATVAQCHEFICALSDGYSTIIGERGIRLSGGQRQRIGIARAVLKAAPILILDEATSALDSETEAAIHGGLLEHLRASTVLAVAHRLSSLTAFDRIVVIDEGRIVEEGVPDDLLRREGFFSRMYARQHAMGPDRQASSRDRHRSSQLSR